MLCYAKSLQSCPTLCNPIDGSPTGSPIPGILQARTLEWVTISFSNAWKWKVKVKSLSRVPQRPQRLQPSRLLHPWDFPGKSTGVRCHCLLRIEHDIIHYRTRNLQLFIQPFSKMFIFKYWKWSNVLQHFSIFKQWFLHNTKYSSYLTLFQPNNFVLTLNFQV